MISGQRLLGAKHDFWVKSWFGNLVRRYFGWANQVWGWSNAIFRSKNGSDNLPNLLMPEFKGSLLAKIRVEIRSHIAKCASKIETGGGNIQPQLRTSQIASDWDKISLELLPGGRAPSVGGTNQNYYWRQRLEKRGCLFERRRRLVYTWWKKV